MFPAKAVLRSTQFIVGLLSSPVPIPEKSLDIETGPYFHALLLDVDLLTSNILREEIVPTLPINTGQRIYCTTQKWWT